MNGYSLIRRSLRDAKRWICMRNNWILTPGFNNWWYIWNISNKDYLLWRTLAWFEKNWGFFISHFDLFDQVSTIRASTRYWVRNLALIHPFLNTLSAKFMFTIKGCLYLKILYISPIGRANCTDTLFFTFWIKLWILHYLLSHFYFKYYE